MIINSYAAITHQGPYLNLNEDDYAIDMPNNLFMVFDGLGGNGIGDICVKELKENIQHSFLNMSNDPDATMPFFYSPQYLLEGNALINAAFYAHKELCQKNQQQEMSKRAAASGILMAQSKEVATFVSVGNCRCYLFRHKMLNKIFIEESLSFMNVGTGQSLPTNAFGLFPNFQFQVKEVRLQAEDIILMMSDGVYAYVSEEEILDFMKKRENLQKKAQRLLEQANAQGNKDNQTLIALKYS